MIESQLPILPVVMPMVAAPICVLLRQRTVVWAFAAFISVLTLVNCGWLTVQVFDRGILHYRIGNWPAPFGIEYRIDAVNALVLLLVSGVNAFVVLAARSSVKKEIAASKLHLFYATYLLAVTGLLGMAATGDAFNVFVFLEISALSSYALIAMGSRREALLAAFRYLVMGTIGGTFFLIGVGLLYMMTGTLNMEDLAQRIQPHLGSRTIQAALAFIVVGLSLKIALFPLHAWLPNAYAHAPSVVSAFLAGTATKVSLYVLLRFVFDIFGIDFSLGAMQFDEVFLWVSLVAIFIGSIAAIYQSNVKRLLAYSSVAQMGYMTLGVSLSSASGVQAGLLHLFNHGLMKGALFLALTAVVYRLDSTRLENLAGAAHRMPWTFAALCAGGLSLIGIPLTAGFVSKWYLVSATLERGLWPVAALVLLSSLLAVIYVWRFIEPAYFGSRPGNEEFDSPDHLREAPWSILVPTYGLVLANLYFGIHTALSEGLTRRAAEVLLGGFS